MAAARDASRVLASALVAFLIFRSRLGGAPHASRTLRLPTQAIHPLLDVLPEMAAGHGVLVRPPHAQVTMEEAADVLNVSRPCLASLLDAGQIPSQKVGTHRRIRLEDLLRYEEYIDRERRIALDALVKESDALGSGVLIVEALQPLGLCP